MQRTNDQDSEVEQETTVEEESVVESPQEDSNRIQELEVRINELMYSYSRALNERDVLNQQLETTRRNCRFSMFENFSMMFSTILFLDPSTISSSEFITSIQTQTRQSITRAGIQIIEMPESGTPIDPERHNIIGNVSVQDESLDRTVSRAYGYGFSTIADNPVILLRIPVVMNRYEQQPESSSEPSQEEQSDLETENLIDTAEPINQ